MSTPPQPTRPGVMRRLGAAGPVAIVLSFAPPLGGFLLLAALTWLGGWLRGHADIGWIVYLACVSALIGLSFVPTFSIGILAGWAFGFVAGWPLSVIATTIGGLIAYWIGRLIARERVLDLVQEHARLRAVHAALLARHGRETLFVVTLLRIPPASPFALANFLLAAARVPLADYTLGTFLGILPRMALTAFVGAGLNQLQFKNVQATWMAVAGIVAAVIVCIILGVLANRALARITDHPAAAEPQRAS